MQNIYIWSGLIIDDLWRILLIKRRFDKKDFPNKRAPPWWKKELRETIEEAAIREVKEEVWVEFYIDKLFIQESFLLDNWERNIFINRYLWKHKWDLKIQESECDWYWWFYYEETKKLNIYNRIAMLLEKLYNENIIK